MEAKFNNLDKIKRLNFENTNKIKEKSAPSPVSKEVEGSAQDAMENYGKAAVNMQKITFKGQAITELTSKEFNEKKKAIKKKIHHISDYTIKQLLKDMPKSLNPYNIFIADKIFNTPILLKHPKLFSTKSLIEKAQTKECAEAQYKILNKLLNNEKLMDNPDVFTNIFWITNGTFDMESANAKCRIIDKITNTPKLYDNTNLEDVLEEIIENTKTKEFSDTICQITDELKDNPNFSGADIVNLIHNTLSISPTIANFDYSKDYSTLAQEVLDKIPEIGEPKIRNLIGKTIKTALKDPRQYLDDIPLSTTKKDSSKNKYSMEKLPEVVDIEYKKRIINWFYNNYIMLAQAYQYLDSDTVNSMMDKRTSAFTTDLNLVTRSLAKKNLELIKEILDTCDTYKTTINGQVIKKPFAGSGRKKVELCEKIEALQEVFGRYLKECPETSGVFKTMLENREFDFDKIGEIINNEIYKRVGITKEELEDNKESIQHLNSKYSHLVATQIDEENEQLYEVFKIAYLGGFSNYINNPKTAQGQINQKTKEEFEAKGLDFEVWNNPKLERKFNSFEGELTMKLWERDPMEDLFIGNKTNCCTGIGEQFASAAPIYLLNKCFNFIELKNPSGETVGTSRVYMSEIEGKPALIMDNIEICPKYKGGRTSIEEKMEIRGEFFKFAKEYAKKVNNNKETPVYFSTSYTNVPTEDLEETEEKVDFIGSIAINQNKKVYINAAPEKINPKSLKDMQNKFYKV